MSQVFVDQIAELLTQNLEPSKRARAMRKYRAEKREDVVATQALSDHTLSNAAVAHCDQASKHAYKAARAAKKDQYASKTLADEAYLKAMPMLDSYQNIRDFIACTTYAMLTRILLQDTATKLLYAAQVASVTLRNIPSPRN
jgi:Asp-tRNA(Asn)/Glu-tRNA(Gln) amidotransferase C subunit